MAMRLKDVAPSPSMVRVFSEAVESNDLDACVLARPPYMASSACSGLTTVPVSLELFASFFWVDPVPTKSCVRPSRENVSAHAVPVPPATGGSPSAKSGAASSAPASTIRFIAFFTRHFRRTARYRFMRFPMAPCVILVSFLGGNPRRASLSGRSGSGRKHLRRKKRSRNRPRDSVRINKNF